MKLLKAHAMKNTKTEFRVTQLKAMDDFMHSVNNEELIDSWLTYGVPDEASEEDYEEIAADDEYYANCVSIFKRTVQDDDCYY